MILKYISQVINLANQSSQATRPKNVGQISDLIQDYRRLHTNPTKEGWELFYKHSVGEHKIDEASQKVWDCIEKIKANLESLTQEDVYDWVHNLIVDKSFSGLQVQLDVLKLISKDSYRLANLEEEAKGIDGYSDGEPVSIKPVSYKTNVSSKNEDIAVRIVFYRINSKGELIIE